MFELFTVPTLAATAALVISLAIWWLVIEWFFRPKNTTSTKHRDRDTDANFNAVKTDSPTSVTSKLATDPEFAIESNSKPTSSAAIEQTAHKTRDNDIGSKTGSTARQIAEHDQSKTTATAVTTQSDQGKDSNTADSIKYPASANQPAKHQRANVQPGGLKTKPVPVNDTSSQPEDIEATPTQHAPAKSEPKTVFPGKEKSRTIAKTHAKTNAKTNQTGTSHVLATKQPNKKPEKTAHPVATSAKAATSAETQASTTSPSVAKHQDPINANSAQQADQTNEGKATSSNSVLRHSSDASSVTTNNLSAPSVQQTTSTTAKHEDRQTKNKSDEKARRQQFVSTTTQRQNDKTNSQNNAQQPTLNTQLQKQKQTQSTSASQKITATESQLAVLPVSEANNKKSQQKVTAKKPDQSGFRTTNTESSLGNAKAARYQTAAKSQSPAVRSEASLQIHHPATKSKTSVSKNRTGKVQAKDKKTSDVTQGEATRVFTDSRHHNHESDTRPETREKTDNITQLSSVANRRQTKDSDHTTDNQPSGKSSIEVAMARQSDATDDQETEAQLQSHRDNTELRAQLAASERKIASLQSTLSNLRPESPNTENSNNPAPKTSGNRVSLLSKVRLLDPLDI